jgi:hypothetical protein
MLAMCGAAEAKFVVSSIKKQHDPIVQHQINTT